MRTNICHKMPFFQQQNKDVIQQIQNKQKLCHLIADVSPNFILTFGNSPSTETLDYVLLEQIYTPIDQVEPSGETISLEKRGEGSVKFFELFSTLQMSMCCTELLFIPMPLQS